jgi:hypothetical protein
MGSAIGDRHERRKRNAVTASKIAHTGSPPGGLRCACAAFRKTVKTTALVLGNLPRIARGLIMIRVKKPWPGGNWLRKAIIHSQQAQRAHGGADWLVRRRHCREPPGRGGVHSRWSG